MRSTFAGFESVRKALMASQKGQDITAQNIANINTEGYTRQRIELASIAAGSGSDTYSVPKGEIQSLGVEITGITQIRDQFLDIRYRENTSSLGKLDAQLSVMQDIENVFDEMNTDGLNARLSNLFNELQEFSKNPEAVEFATVFRSACAKVVQVFNQYAAQLSEAREQAVYELRSVTNELNTYTSRIAQYNKEIRNLKIQGYSANELSDERNLLLDKLSAMANVSVVWHEDGGVSLKNGDEYLLNAQQNDTVKKLSVKEGTSAGLVWENGTEADIVNGKIAGYLEALNGKGVFAKTGETGLNGLSYFQHSLDLFAAKFADTFNKINDPIGINKLFTGQGNTTITAATIKISDQWQNNVQFLKTSAEVPVEEGRNSNLLKMIDAMNSETQVTPFFEGSFEEYATALMDDMSVEVNYLTDIQKTAQAVADSIQNQRESVMGVSLDEEGMNIVRYQKSYAAAARVMTAMDDMLDVLINELGLVGR